MTGVNLNLDDWDSSIITTEYFSEYVQSIIDTPLYLFQYFIITFTFRASRLYFVAIHLMDNKNMSFMSTLRAHA